MMFRAGSHVVLIAAFALAGGTFDTCKSCKKSGDATDAALGDASAPSPTSDASLAAASNGASNGGAQLAVPQTGATPIPTTTVPPPKPPAPPGPFVAGDLWSGSFSCNGSTNFTLQIMSVSSEIDAVFAYTRNKAPGRFTMRGTYQRDTHHIAFYGNTWMMHPKADVMVNLDGIVAPGGHTMTGKAIGPGCSTFKASTK